MKNISIYPKNIHYLANNMGLIALSFVFLLATGYDNLTCRYISLIISSLTLFILLYRWLILKSIRWIITDEQIIYEYGFLSKQINYLELYRIYDYREQQNFIEQLIKTKRIEILSGDKSNPRLIIFGIKSESDVVNKIRERVETNKQNKHIYEISNK